MIEEYYRLFGKKENGPFIFIREFYNGQEINNQLDSIRDEYKFGYIDYFNQKTFEARTVGYIEFDLGMRRELKK